MQAKNRLPLLILFFCLLIYLFIGVYPFTHYETDALGIISGCKYIIEAGVFSANYYTYGFEMQPGIYFCVILFAKIFQCDFIVSYSILSALFGVLFLLSSTYFISRITSISYLIVSMLLLLFQETYSSWYYMNSATGAAFLMIMGLIIIENTPSFYRIFLSSSLFALSAWIRFDVVIVFPVILFLIESSSIKKTIVWATNTGLITLLLMAFLYNLSNISLYTLFAESVGGNKISFADNVKSAGGIFSSQMIRSTIGFFSLLLVFLIMAGTFYLLKKRQWKILFLSYFSFILFIVILKGNFTAGKHLLYFIPFLGIPVVIGFKQIVLLPAARLKLAVISIIVLLFFTQYIIGFQFFFRSHPYISKDYSSVYPYPTYANLLKLKFETGPFDSTVIVVGSGMKLATADEMLLSSGIIYAPLMWYKLKKDSKEIYSSITHFINEYSGDTLYITTSQGGGYPIKNILYLEGYRLINPEANAYQWDIKYSYIWERRNKYVVVEQATYPKDYEQYIDKVKKATHPIFLHLAFWDWERWYMQKYSNYSTKINDAAYLFEIKKSTH